MKVLSCNSNRPIAEAISAYLNLPLTSASIRRFSDMEVFVEIDEIILFVNQEKDKLNEAERDQITIAMKVDVESKMGIVSDVQQELREANARKILYSSIQTIDI